MHAGDNLGSHCTGGFCFSRTHHFCRYCLMTQSVFQGGDPNQCGAECTIEMYNSPVEHLKTEGTPDIEGVKFESVFNCLKYFHICQPSLPLCLGHNIFRAFRHMMMRCFLNFGEKKEWFNLSILNWSIKQFKYSDSDTSSKQCEVSPQTNSQDS